MACSGGIKGDPGGVVSLSILLGTHARHKKCRNKVGFWPCGVNDVFRKRYLFHVNLQCLGSLFLLSFDMKGKFFGLIVAWFSKGFPKHIFFP